ncbi:MAG: SIS domain-containing protein [Candidatus Methanomethylicaceae archaeon]
MGNTQFVEAYFKDIEVILKKISQQEITKAVNLLYNAWKQDRQIFLIGNGGSASTATHFASDLSKSCSVEGKPRFRAMALTDNAPLISALVNDEGWSNVYTWQLQNLMLDGDLLVAISVHGGSGSDKAGLWSQNLLKAVKFVKDRKGKVLGFSGFDGGALKGASDVCIVVPINSTPQVEGFHSVLTHLLAERLHTLIAES